VLYLFVPGYCYVLRELNKHHSVLLVKQIRLVVVETPGSRTGVVLARLFSIVPGLTSLCFLLDR